MIKHISFDLFGTLIKSPDGFKNERAKLLQTLCFKHFNKSFTFEECVNAIRKVEKMGTKLAVLANTQLNIEAAWLFAISELSIVPNEKFLTQLIEQVDELYLGYEIPFFNVQTPRVLNRIFNEHIEMSIISNTCFIRGNVIRKQLKRMKIAHLFTNMLFSDETGYLKPHLEAFTSLIDANPLDEIVHVGDKVETDGACTQIPNVEFYRVHGPEGNTLVTLLNRIYV